ncbi:MAG: hypothetical protein ACI97A_000806 [Planctomycetota bacterium]|jgi:hypothetical protein
MREPADPRPEIFLHRIQPIPSSAGFRLGHRITADDYLNRAAEADAVGAHKDKRMCLERALALSRGDDRIQIMLARHHLDCILGRS